MAIFMGAMIFPVRFWGGGPSKISTNMKAGVRGAIKKTSINRDPRLLEVLQKLRDNLLEDIAWIVIIEWFEEDKKK